LANGGGMGMYFGLQAEASERMMEAAKLPHLTFAGRSFSLHVFEESVVLDYFRFGEFLGQQEVDKEIFRRVMQDEARHVSFATMHLKYGLEHLPKARREEAIEALHIAADAVELGFGGYFMGHTATVESMAILAGGSANKLEAGLDIYRHMWHRTVS